MNLQKTNGPTVDAVSPLKKYRSSPKSTARARAGKAPRQATVLPHAVDAAPLGQRVTMTSRDIADLVEKRHDNVMRTVEMLALRGVLQLPQIEEVKNHLGQTVEQYRVNQRDSYIIVAQLSPEFTAKLVDRWQTLEAAAAAALPQTFSLPQTYSQALRLCADQCDQLDVQVAQLALAAPKVAFVDSYVSAHSNKGFRQVCKLLKANERSFGQWLDDAGITYRLAGERTAYQQHTTAGRFVMKAGISGTDDEPGHAFNQLLFTPKGVEWIAGEWAKSQLKGGVA